MPALEASEICIRQSLDRLLFMLGLPVCSRPASMSALLAHDECSPLHQLYPLSPLPIDKQPIIWVLEHDVIATI